MTPLKISPRAIKRAERSELGDMLQQTLKVKDEILRRAIIEDDRIDLLATEVLGFHLEPFHLHMMKWQFDHPDNLQLVFRGAGKSTTCTVTKVIHLLLKNPNLRICIASKVVTQSQAFLKEIKNHFEGNEALARIFGPYFDPQKVTKWDETEIEVLPRTSTAKEASVTAIGVGGMTVGKHYDVIISDDLVDEANSATKLQRKKVRKWYYSSLDPTLEPPDPEVEHRGEHHRLGTRYHYDDLYGHLITNELKEHHNIIPALGPCGRSPWPDKYPPKFFAEKRRKSGTIIFNAQYQCDTEAMKGEIFQYDHCQKYDPEKLPGKMRIFMGVDLAIAESDKADMFAIVVIGVTPDRYYYVLDFYEARLRFGAQTKKILEYYKKYDPVRCAIETNAYQLAQYQNLKDGDRDLRLKKVITDKDKRARAWKLSSLFEDGRVFFSPSHEALISHLVLFPSFKFMDLFDAFDLAVKASKMRKRKRRRRNAEPGLI